MVDTTQEPIKVSANAGIIDLLQAAGRYAVVIVGFVTALLTLFKAHDLAGAAVYAQNNLGQAIGAILGLVAAGTAAYGIFKSGKRGSQLATVAADDAVPDEVAQIK